MPFLTLTTDFGLRDNFVGALKGVLLSICPDAQITDISHQIAPQNVLEGALTLWCAYSYFPAGTVHLAVVDPGVGMQRRPLAMRAGEWYFVGPDNGIFTPVLEDAGKCNWPVEIVHLTNPRYWRPEISHTFHGRDIFAPVAAHLANGVPLMNLGPVIVDPQRIRLPRSERRENGWRAHIISIDVFGNLVTDLPADQIADPKNIRFWFQGRKIRGMVTAFGEGQVGEFVALGNSAGLVEIAVVNGNAAQITGARVGEVVEVTELR
jgi:hypothetical protein